MSESLRYFNLILGFGTIVLQAVCVIVIGLYFFGSKNNKILDFIKKHFLIIGFLLSLSAVATSLFYSDIIGYAPCKLCWLQRIAIYPACLLFFLAFLRKDRSISYYLTPMLVLGSIVSVYHNYIYYFGEGTAPCDSSGVSCVQRLVSEFGGYISITSMSLTVFFALFVLLGVAHFYKKGEADIYENLQ
jgi:disulfide bond formation protein DsbB